MYCICVCVRGPSPSLPQGLEAAIINLSRRAPLLQRPLSLYLCAMKAPWRTGFHDHADDANYPPDCASIAVMVNKACSKRAAEITSPRSCEADASNDGDVKKEKKRKESKWEGRRGRGLVDDGHQLVAQIKCVGGDKTRGTAGGPNPSHLTPQMLSRATPRR